MPRTHPPYPPEFKRQMLELVRAGRVRIFASGCRLAFQSEVLLRRQAGLCSDG